MSGLVLRDRLEILDVDSMIARATEYQADAEGKGDTATETYWRGRLDGLLAARGVMKQPGALSGARPCVLTGARLGREVREMIEGRAKLAMVREAFERVASVAELSYGREDVQAFTRAVLAEIEPCETCEGTGEVTRSREVCAYGATYGETRTWVERCGRCEGRGV